MRKYLQVTNGRFWIHGHRLHHGLTGMWMIALGVMLIIHDWRDHKVWITDWKIHGSNSS